MTIHPQVPVLHPRWGEAVEIDEEIAPLISDLWTLDIDTLMSCQDNVGGRVWIEFPHVEEVRNFLSVVVPAREEGLESLYNRAVGCWEPEDWGAFRENRKWQYDIQAFDWTEGAERSSSVPDIEFPVSVRFPRSDLATVATRVRERRLYLQGMTCAG